MQRSLYNLFGKISVTDFVLSYSVLFNVQITQLVIDHNKKDGGMPVLP